MILINLLPPELRRVRRSGVSPVYLAAAAGIIVVFTCAGTWAWIEFGRIKVAEAKLVERKLALEMATAEANKVREIDKQIAAAEKLHGTISGLIGRKVLWARTLNEFCNLLATKEAGPGAGEGYEVRCTGLTIAPGVAAAVARGQKAAGETLSFSFRASFKIVGDKRDEAGDYLRSFFQVVEMSKFWREHGFVGRAEDPFRGDSPKEAADIGKVVTDLPLEWRRVKVMPGAQR